MINKKKLNIIGAILFISVILIFVVKNLIDAHKLKINNRYTIGVITKIEPNIRSGYRFTFYYKIKGEKYSAFGGIYKKDTSLIGKRFYIQYSLSDPRNCKILLGCQVPDSIITAPPDGWKKIPQ